MKLLRFMFAILLMFVSAFAFSQTIGTANPNVENPPYGMIAQLWNSTSSTIYLDMVEVNGAPVGTFTGTIIFGIGLSNLEEQWCQSVGGFQLGTAALTPTPVGVRVSQQPCLPHGLAYRVAYTGPGNCGGLNYTCTNFMSMKTCYVWTCAETFATEALAIPPSTGVTIYTARYVEPGAVDSGAFGWTGYSAVHFRWHDHAGCPAQPINNMFCIQ